MSSARSSRPGKVGAAVDGEPPPPAARAAFSPRDWAVGSCCPVAEGEGLGCLRGGRARGWGGRLWCHQKQWRRDLYREGPSQCEEKSKQASVPVAATHPDAFPNQLTPMRDCLCLVDGGFAINSPFPLNLLPQRAVDLILSFDYSLEAPFEVKCVVGRN